MGVLPSSWRKMATSPQSPFTQRRQKINTEAVYNNRSEYGKEFDPSYLVDLRIPRSEPFSRQNAPSLSLRICGRKKFLGGGWHRNVCDRVLGRNRLIPVTCEWRE
ncbi:hypothetical protein CDAR_524771 [Caerostris darwini]|uniref:Uncharacterized protein n=1 Tax=Caerostris darwini TaxID=1538125 RepID=A0AAV4R0R3_9ARAC|nr:hypothetical protein CDAR_524771 [Caerostris darwini]